MLSIFYFLSLICVYIYFFRGGCAHDLVLINMFSGFFFSFIIFFVCKDSPFVFVVVIVVVVLSLFKFLLVVGIVEYIFWCGRNGSSLLVFFLFMSLFLYAHYYFLLASSSPSFSSSLPALLLFLLIQILLARENGCINLWVGNIQFSLVFSLYSFKLRSIVFFLFSSFSFASFFFSLGFPSLCFFSYGFMPRKLYPLPFLLSFPPFLF